MDLKIKGPSKAMAIICYLLIYALIGAILILLSVGIVGAINGAGFGRCVSLYVYSDYTKGTAGITDLEYNAYYIGSGFGNFLTYLLLVISIVFYMRDEFKGDLFAIKENPKFYGIYIPIAAILFAGAAIGISIIFGNFTDSSENQKLIEGILNHAGAVPMILATIILAPIVEEAIYRKCVFHYFRKYPIWLSYIFSALLFALPHMLTTSTSFVNWFLIALPYVIDGLLLALVYHLSKKNIYAVIAAHMLNNIIAVIIVFI